MAESRHTCPKCGAIDLNIKVSGIVDSGGNSVGSTATCGCGWQGPLNESVGVITTENFFGIEDLAHLMVMLVAKNLAGPLWQLLVFTGLVEQDDEIGRKKILDAAFTGLIISVFEAAAARREEIQNNKGVAVANTKAIQPAENPLDDVKFHHGPYGQQPRINYERKSKENDDVEAGQTF